MRNVHILPTDKPSRLIIYSTLLNEFRLLNEPIEDWKHKRNIYITSNEEIKEGDWFIHSSHGITNFYKAKSVVAESIITECGNGCWIQYCKKVILTTDSQLITNGVQPLPDTFIEWFINNSSCEFVEVSTYHVKGDISGKLHYKIIIPQEEPKKGINIEEFEKKANLIIENVGKEETLEEAAERLAKIHCDARVNPNTTEFQIQQFIIKGAKWQAERMYSKFDLDAEITKLNTPDRYDNVKHKYNYSESDIVNLFEEWFEQFKKK
jgi:hypothetical protein